MASLRDRLMGRSGTAKPAENGTGNGAHPPLTKPSPTATGPIAPITDVRPTAPGHSRQSLASRGSSTFTHKLETAALSPVEQLKVDLHRRLIERLDLEALEAIKDESVLVADPQRRRRVSPRRADAAQPIEREEIIEQIV